jgi:hypothetical protein
LAFASAPASAAKVYVPGGSFGSGPCTVEPLEPCEGKFKEPTSIAVNDSLVEPTAGDVYVLDKGNNRVEWFNSTGSKFEGQFNGSGTFPNEKGATAPEPLSAPEGIAIDNSGKTVLEDPAVGDVYLADIGHNVIDRFGATGKYEGQLTGICETPGELPPSCAGSKLISFVEIHGVAVDPSGNVWVYDTESEEKGRVDEFSDTGTFIKAFNTEHKAVPGMAVDAANVYVIALQEAALQFESATGAKLAQLGEASEAGELHVSALASNAATGDLLVDKTKQSGGPSSIAIYRPVKANGEELTLLETLPEIGLSESFGVAVNSSSATATVYASQRGANSVEFFNFVPLASVSEQGASEVTSSAATLNASVNPEGEPLTECKFEYGESTAYGQEVACEQTPAGTQPVPVTGKISGLTARTTYHFRLVVANKNGSTSGGDTTFYTVDEPTIQGESASEVGPTTATVAAQINPSGLPTTYHLEYGTTTGYGSSTPERSLGAGHQVAGVQIQVAGLQPGTAYHARLVASNELGVVLGADVAFSTTSTPSAVSLLPDERAYELVSTTGKFGEVYSPDLIGSSDGLITSRRLVQASADGNAVAYVGGAAAAGGNGATAPGGGNEWLGKRTAEGWLASDITVPQTGEGAYFESFSSDLTSWLLRWEPSGERPFQPLTPGAPGECQLVPYLHHSGGSYEPLITATKSHEHGRLACGEPEYAGASAEDSQILFQSQAALTEEAEEAEEPSGGHTATGNGEKCSFSCNLYDSTGGRLGLVNLLPNGETAPSATFGGTSPNHGNPADFSNVISADGSRIFWTDTQPGPNMEHIYVRESGTSTAPVSAGAAKFWTATPDGRYAFYTAEGGLFRFDVDTHTREALAVEGLSHENAGVQGVIGTNQTGEDGAYVYLVATGVLAANETAGNEKAELGEDNLYVFHNGEPTFIAILSPGDNEVSGAILSNNELYGDWQPDLGSRTAQVTADGRHLVFQSLRPLTGYRNVSVFETGATPEVEVEAFVYAADAGRIICASCNPTGAPPAIPPTKGRTRLTPSYSETHMRHWVTDDGAHVFFTSSQPLVSQDANRQLDVYEWEQEGTPSCPGTTPARRDGGCVFLLSGGQSSESSVFAEATPSGSDVFLATRAQLVRQDRDEKNDLYDVRVAGGFPETSLACAGTGCQGVPPAPPAFATPSSATFSGVGNFARPPAKPKTAAQIKAEKLAKALKACKKHRSTTKRTVCQKQARRKYGPTKAKKSAHTNRGVK